MMHDYHLDDDRHHIILITLCIKGEHKRNLKGKGELKMYSVRKVGKFGCESLKPVTEWRICMHNRSDVVSSSQTKYFFLSAVS